MQLTSTLKGLGQNDMRLISRDSFLVYLMVVPTIYALICRYAVPYLNEQLAEWLTLSDYYPLMVSYMFVMMSPYIAGVVIGFMLLDDRDEGLLSVMLVTPLPLNTFLTYRLFIPAVLGFVLTIITVPLSGLATIAPFDLVAVALVMALFAPITSLLFATFAENKVQGFGMVKVLGTVNLLPVVGYFIPTPWQYLVGLIYPPYWPVAALWQVERLTFWLFLLIGLLLQSAMLAYLWQRFKRIAYAA